MINTKHVQKCLFCCVSSDCLHHSFNAEITQAPSKIKHNEFVNLTCTMTVDQGLIGPVKWLGQKLGDKPQEVITSNKQSPDTLLLNVTEEWIGAQIWCGVEYSDLPEPLNPEEPVDSVRRWSNPHRLNGMHTQ